MSHTTAPLSPNELETLIRRVVRDELARLLRTPARSILEDWRQEGPENASEDQLLLGEALSVIEAHGDRPDDWVSWEHFEAELDRAEAAGEVPR